MEQKLHAINLLLHSFYEKSLQIPLQDVVNHLSSIKDLIVRFAYVSKNDSWTISPFFWASSTTFACKESFTEFPNMKMTFTSSISSWSFAHVSRIVFLWSTLPTAEQTTISNNTSSFDESGFWVHISLGSILVVLWSGWTSLWTLLVWLMGQTNATAGIIQLWKFSKYLISIYHFILKVGMNWYQIYVITYVVWRPYSNMWLKSQSWVKYQQLRWWAADGDVSSQVSWLYFDG